jgi:uncharacterized protein (DUF885 family)
MHFTSFDRRRLLLAGAGALAGCASAEAQPVSAAGDPAADAEFREFADRLAQRTPSARPFLLRRFDASRLTPQGRALYDAIVPGAEAEAALSQSPWGSFGVPYAVTSRNGAYRRAAELNPADDLRIALREVNRDTNRLEADAAAGVIAPDFAIDAVIPEVESAAQRVAASGEERLAPLVEALNRQADVLRAQRARASSDAGVWRLPDGEEFYANTLQLQLGAPVDPREAHGEALEHCRALQREAETLLRRQGLTSGSVGERLRTLAHDPRYLTGTDEDGATRALLDMGARLSRIRSLFGDVIPEAGSITTTPAEVGRLPRAQEANGTAGRRTGNAYLIDLGAPRPSWTLPSVVHHELIPGHILQNYFLYRSEPLELQARYASGYGEGWAIYAEQLADDVGAFADDPLGRIGYLQWMLFRYGRIVADTGINAMRWSRERAITEMRALQGDSIAFVSIEDDVLRFCVQPGVYAAQGLAARHIADLRERTRRTRGFTMARFHEAVLRYGPLSPAGLTQAVRAAFAV